MFTYIRLKNFRSFKDLSFNLQNKTKFKKFALIYGENGMGNSNLSLGFVIFKELMETMHIRDFIEHILSIEDLKKLSELDINDDIALSHLKNQMQGIKGLINKYRTIDSDEPILLEYEFIINSKKGKYLVELGSDEVIHERLEYTLEKNKGIYFDLTPTQKKINNKIFSNAKTHTDILALINKFWGKHTLLAILLHEQDDKSQNYISNSLSKNFSILIKSFINVSYLTKLNKKEVGSITSTFDLEPNLEYGKINNKQITKLNTIEKVLSALFHSINSDNLYLYYKKERVNDTQIKYQLFIKKLIANKKLDIPFSLESTGNHQILSIFPFILSAISGGTVIVDEIDTGIHDLLFQKIIKEIYPILKGQLIITSHNTTLLEINEIRDNIYFIVEDNTANKFIKCTTDYSERTYQQNNMRKKYLNNSYGGIPAVDKIGFNKLISILNKIK